MTNNDIIKRLRYALNYNNITMITIFKHAGVEMTQAQIDAMMKPEEEEGFEPLKRTVLGLFLDGLIIHKRGIQQTGKPPVKRNLPLTNNVILRKLKIAMSFKDDDMVEVMTLAGDSVSKAEISALFQAQDHKNFKECHDQFLRTFIKGLTLYTRKDKK